MDFKEVIPIFKKRNGIVQIIIVLLLGCSINLKAQVVKQAPTLVDAGDMFTYTLNFTCPSTTAGDCENVVVSDFIPSGLEYETGTFGSTYNSGTGEWSFDLGTVGNGSTVSVSFIVNVPATTLSGVEFENVATVTTNTSTITSPTVTTTVDNGFVINYTDTHNINKPGITVNISDTGMEANYDFEYGNNSDMDITNFVVEDILPSGHILNSDISLTDLPACSGSFNFTVDVALSDGSYLSLGTDYFGETGSFVSTMEYNNFIGIPTELTDYLGITGNAEYPVGLRLTFPTFPQNCGHKDLPDEPRIDLSAYFDETATGVQDPEVGDLIDNCADTSSDQLPNKQDCGTATFIQPTNGLGNPKNNRTANSPYEPFEYLEFEIRIAGFNGNVGVENTNLYGIDILPPEFTFVQFGSLDGTHSATGTWFSNPVTINPGSTTDLPVLNVISDYQGTGSTAFELIWSDATQNNVTWPAGENGSYRLYYVVQVNGDTPAGDYDNTFAISTSVPIDNCDYYITDVNDLDNDGDTSDELCAEDVSVPIIIPPGFAGLNSYKEVNGNLDTPGDFSRFPANGEVSPGGNINYIMCLENPFAEPIDNIVIVDVLPHVGDIGVVANDENRESVWRPEFNATTLSDLQAYAATIPGSVLEFSTECMPCLAADLGAPVTDLAGCTNPNWSTSPPAILTDVCAFKITVDPSFTLNQDDVTCIDFNMNAPSDVATDGSIAWNSFGFVGVKDDGSSLLASEPIKVGIEALPPTCTNPMLTALVDHSICEGGSFDSNSITTSVTNGVSATYQWYDNNGTDNSGTAMISGQTTATLTALPTVEGTYSYRIEAIDSSNSSCTTSETVNLTILDSPAATAITINATCSGATSNDDGQIMLSGFNTGERYALEENSSYTGSATFASGSTAIPADGIIANNLVNPSGITQYTIRIFNSEECYIDRTVDLNEWTCICLDPMATPSPALICVGSIDTIYGNPTGGSGVYSIHAWTDLNTGTASGYAFDLTNSENMTLDATAATAGTINLQYYVEDNIGCSTTIEHTITLTLPESKLICDDASNYVEIAAQAGLTNVVWFNSADTQVGLGDTLVVDANTLGMGDGMDSYYYTAEDASGCEAGLCCSVIVTLEDCCKPEICLPFRMTIKRGNR